MMWGGADVPFHQRAAMCHERTHPKQGLGHSKNQIFFKISCHLEFCGRCIKH